MKDLIKSILNAPVKAIKYKTNPEVAWNVSFHVLPQVQVQKSIKKIANKKINLSHLSKLVETVDCTVHPIKPEMFGSKTAIQVQDSSVPTALPRQACQL